MASQAETTSAQGEEDTNQVGDAMPCCDGKKKVDILEQKLPGLLSLKRKATYLLFGTMFTILAVTTYCTWKRSAWIIPHRIYKRPATHMGYVKGKPPSQDVVESGASGTDSIE